MGLVSPVGTVELVAGGVGAWNVQVDGLVPHSAEFVVKAVEVVAFGVRAVGVAVVT